MPSIVLFDGVCNMCNGVVKFIFKRDKDREFYFASLQSDRGQRILKEHHGKQVDSVVLLRDGQLYYFSDAALHIAKKLDGGWKLFFIFIVIPRKLRDLIYKFIARNRYKWFGKKEECMLPTKEMRERFLE
ncbi:MULTISPECIES: thiol-disulfide oxidoreductase DCC family protein [Bacillus]|uniref:thiol-disulfide oxidoreductase DCC family protein n=1 Tax=Bacillus TaxID=1386 RepID=UPI000BB80D37|nr:MULTISPECIES: thiol-disulfide oxidoreductase DCC family protein [Bacillus]